MNRRWLILGACALLLLIGNWLRLDWHHKAAPKGPQAIPVDVATVAAKDVPKPSA